MPAICGVIINDSLARPHFVIKINSEGIFVKPLQVLRPVS